jgi:hypothetical protein
MEFLEAARRPRRRGRVVVVTESAARPPPRKRQWTSPLPAFTNPGDPNPEFADELAYKGAQIFVATRTLVPTLPGVLLALAAGGLVRHSLAAQQLGRDDLSARLERAWRAGSSMLRLRRWLGSASNAAALRKGAAQALEACPKQASRQRASCMCCTASRDVAAYVWWCALSTKYGSRRASSGTRWKVRET